MPALLSLFGALEMPLPFPLPSRLTCARPSAPVVGRAPARRGCTRHCTPLPSACRTCPFGPEPARPTRLDPIITGGRTRGHAKRRRPEPRISRMTANDTNYYWGSGHWCNSCDSWTSSALVTFVATLRPLDKLGTGKLRARMYTFARAVWRTAGALRRKNKKIFAPAHLLF